jgi:hypothetical protein
MDGNSRHRQPDALFNAQVSVNGAFQFFGSDGHVILNGNYLRS